MSAIQKPSKMCSALLIGLIVVLIAACGPSTSTPVAQPQATEPPAAQPAPTEEPLEKLTISIGVLEISSYQQVFEYYDKKFNIINEAGKEFGYDLEVNWLTFPHAPEELAAMKAGDIQFGSIATFPFVAQLAQDVPIHALTQSIGSYDFLLLVNKDSEIRNFDDLKGKKIGLSLGSEYQLLFENFVMAEFGATPQELGMEYVSQPMPLPIVPEGIDARVLHVPATVPALAAGNMESLMSFLGTTGEHYDGPLGQGAGHAIPSAEQSPFAPEGYSALRHYFCTYGDFIDEHPDVVKAFVIAHQKVIQEVNQWSISEIADLYPVEFWETMDRQQFEDLSLAVDLVYKHRDWVWTTAGEMSIALRASEIMAAADAIESPLTEEEWCAAFDESAPILKAVYEELGYPAQDVFTDPDATDVRGVPAWEVCGQ